MNSLLWRTVRQCRSLDVRWAIVLAVFFFLILPVQADIIEKSGTSSENPLPVSTFAAAPAPQQGSSDAPVSTRTDQRSRTSLDDNGGPWFGWTGALVIPDDRCATSVSAEIVVSGMGYVLDVNVLIVNLVHTYDGDLNFFLHGPNGASVPLCIERGGSGDNFINTLFDDQATTPISAGSAPFTGSFQPEYSINYDFAGSSANGTWELEICDSASSDIGTLYEWRIQIQCGPAPVNNLCSSVTPVSLPATFYGTSTCAVNDCPIFGGGHVWVAFTVAQTSNVFLDFCGSVNPYSNLWLNLALGCPCTGFTSAGVYETSSCPDGRITIRWYGLDPGTYYYPVVFDPSNGSGGSYEIHVGYIPICDDYTLNAPGSVNGNTCGAINDCGLRGSEDQTVFVHIPYEADWTFSLCTSASSWDSFIYLTSQCCNSSTIIAADDDGCGSYGLSQIYSVHLMPGDYYLTVESYGYSCGEYTLEVYPRTGRCCYGSIVEPSCMQTDPAHCDALGGVYAYGINCLADPCAYPPACPPEAIVSQPAHQWYLNWGAQLVERNNPYFEADLYEDFSGITTAMNRLTFWATQIQSGGGSWISCLEDPLQVYIDIFADSSGYPGSLVCSYDLSLTGQIYDYYRWTDSTNHVIYKFTAELNPYCYLPNGWIRIEGGGDPYCILGWLNSDYGNNRLLLWEDGEWTEYPFDLSLCIEQADCEELAVPDDCPGRTIAALPYTDHGTTNCAVNDFVNCIGSSSPDVVYSYTPAQCENITVTLCGSFYDTGLEIRASGACPGIASVSCNDDSWCGSIYTTSSTASFQAQAYDPHYFIVHGYNLYSGSYTIQVTTEPCAVVPDPVTDLVAMLQTTPYPALSLHWSPTTGATSYSIYHSTDLPVEVNPGNLLTTTVDTFFADPGVYVDPTPMYYVVVAENAARLALPSRPAPVIEKAVLEK